MRKEELLKQWTVIFIASLIFYLGFFIFTVLPELVYEDIFWETNVFLLALRILVGVGVFISFTVMLLMMALSVWPKLRTFDYLYIGMIILSLGLVDMMLADEMFFNTPTTVTIFLSIMAIVLILQIIARIMIKTTDEGIFKETWKQGVESLYKVDHTKREKLTKILMTVIVVLVFVALSGFEAATDQVVIFIVIFALGFYVIRIYHGIYNFGKTKKIIDIVFFILTYTGILVILLYFHEFFVMHTVLKSLIVLLPFFPVLKLVVPHFYTIYWQEKHQEIK